MKRTISRKAVRKTDVEFMKEFVVESEKQYVDHRAGESAYRLFAHISKSWNNIKIGEVGARNFSSSIAFSVNPKNLVCAYEIDRHYFQIGQKIAERIPNLEVFEYNVLEDSRIDELSTYDVIFLDPTPHCGDVERKVIDSLIKKEWKGILILDDVTEDWPGMIKMWNELPEDLIKYNLTDIGSRTGTHVIDFSRELEIV